MYITEFSADGFRNLKQVSFQPDKKLNLIIGDNAQGKTNLLDALWLMTGCRSFHGVKERHYLGFDAPFFQCRMQFFDDRRIQEIRCSLERGQKSKKQISVNGVENQKANTLFEIFHCVAFSPEDMELVTGIPEKRRLFMDLCACQLRPNRVQYVSQANLLLSQRNASIQKALKHKIRNQDVLIWDNQLAQTGAYLTLMRSEYIQNLAPLCERLYGVITGGKETLHISYKNAFGLSEGPPDPSIDVLTEQYRNMLASHLEDDLRLGYTQKGIQRDDLLLTINGKSVQQFGSQGQKKTTALVLKLAQAHLYNQKLKRSPVVLLDDVMGELDERRQKFLYDTVSDMQVFITLCHASSLRLRQKAKVFQMHNGILSEI